jgi:hypothetical protein
VAIVGAQQQESSSAKIAGEGMHDRQREAGSHGSIDSVSAGLKDMHSGVRGQVMHTHHHPMLGADRLLVTVVEAARSWLLSHDASRAQGRNSKYEKKRSPEK